MKSINDLLQYAEHFLQANGIDDWHFEAKELILFATGIERSSFSFHLHDFVQDHICAKIDEMLIDRANGIPLQYVIGEWDFFGNTFFVLPGVLIPRPETEELTDIAISFIKNNNCKTVCDICSGTGCIGLSVAFACPDTEVYLFELYEQPLHCINLNIKKHGLQNVHVIKCDVLQGPTRDINCADVIISNPPYIPTIEIQSLQREVLKEPLTALDGGDDGLVFYRAFAEKWFRKLNRNGAVFFECAEDQASSIVDLFVDKHPDIEYAYGMTDFYGLDRFVCIKKKG